MKLKLIIIIITITVNTLIAFFCGNLFAQEFNNDITLYHGGEEHVVKFFSKEFDNKTPKNVILFIGDGMGISHLFAGLTANRGNLFIENCKYIGLSKTSSATRYVTDSAAGATAISTGVKTYNGAIGVDINKNNLKTILEEASDQGKATGLVSTSSITHATPASFIAHQLNRNQEEEIAADFLKTDITVFIGGGYDFFTKREDGRNLVDELIGKGYSVERELSEIKCFNGKKLAGLTAAKGNGRITERGNMLPVSTKTAINVLQQYEAGFFLMVEGSFIDSGGHENNTVQVIEEILDFDQAIGFALEFAYENGETLVIVTSDHETGGMAILDGSFETGMVKGGYATSGHTGIIVPIFSYGPGASEFIGIMENTDIHTKIRKLLLK